MKACYAAALRLVHPDKLETGVFPEEALLARLILEKLQAAHAAFRRLPPGLR